LVYVTAETVTPLGYARWQGAAPDEWIKEVWYLHTMEFYSATKKKEILSFIILRELSQVQKDKSCMFSLICGM
jgi:hypothetical protein